MTDIKYNSTPSEAPPSYETAAKPANGAAGKPSPALRVPLPLDLPALNTIRGKRVILASASPRRKLLLAQVCLGASFRVPLLTKCLDRLDTA